VTIYRESSAGDKCPLGGLYVQVPRSDEASSGSKCKEATKTGKNKDTMIMQCSDPSMLKLQFGKCSPLPSTFLL
jgi:hypothetical protein